MVLPLTHFVVSSEFVRSPMLSARPAIEGITESNSVNSFCSFAFFAASAALRAASAAMRAASAAMRAASAALEIVVSPEEVSFKTKTSV